MLEKIAKTLKITAICVVALIVAALLYYVPWATPVDLTLNAVKLDEVGNEIGTAQIHIKGKKLDYLFRDSRLDIEIEPFDYVTRFQLSQGSSGLGTISTHSFLDPDLMSIFGSGYISSNYWCFVHIYFTEEMDCFAIRLRDPGDAEDRFFVASASGNYDTQGILDFFNNIAGGIVPER